ncbi:hypothetical protein M6B38_238360 [Iris pallida]|uniref:Uncharacterized protein n=1 Tax=Iris pallida TaxID=29817 RepID=A0AAX6DLH1_IRIPA|nr:hypothetical protein M6B38_238355 [Iris pallida]KAJ6792581.1 hypothetical protein M6B38_238360 [Iris pallida]
MTSYSLIAILAWFSSLRRYRSLLRGTLNLEQLNQMLR